MRITKCNSGIKKERSPTLKKVIPLESVVADVENGHHKSIKRSLQEYGKENVNYVNVSPYLN